jgi:hypothetical protein
MAARHEFARDSARKADNNFRVLEEGSEARIRLFTKIWNNKDLWLML